MLQLLNLNAKPVVRSSIPSLFLSIESFFRLYLDRFSASLCKQPIGLFPKIEILSKMIYCSFDFLQGIVKFDRVGDRENTIEILQQQGVLYITFPKSLLIQNCSQILKVKIMFKELSHIPTFHFQVIPGQWSDCVTNLPPC